MKSQVLNGTLNRFSGSCGNRGCNFLSFLFQKKTIGFRIIEDEASTIYRMPNILFTLGVKSVNIV